MMLFPPREATTTASRRSLICASHDYGLLPIAYGVMYLLLAFGFQLSALRSSRPGGEAFLFIPYYYRSFSCFLTTIFSMRFSVARSAFTTAAAAGAVHISAFIIHFIQTKHIGVCRPGGEAFQCIQCILWFEISCSFVPFVVTENIWLWPTATPVILWCPKSKNFRVLSCLFVVPVQ